MHALLLSALLVTAGGPAVEIPGYTANQDAAAAIAPELETGSLLFSNGDCLPIKVFSAGPYTHVAAVVVKEDGPWVYDAQNGAGVRKLALERYFAAQNSDEVHVYHPRRPFSPDEAEEFESYLESQLGVPYAVAHHLTGERSEDGVHCAEYMTDALMAVDRIHADSPPRVSPSSLAKGITRDSVYLTGPVFQLEPAVPIEPIPDTWCARMWSETKTCMARSCSQLSAWFLCR